MPDDRLEHLVKLVPPPATTAGSIDWTAVEGGLGVRLPNDYKLLIRTYGVGKFDDFIWVLHPTTPNNNLRLESQIQRCRWALKEVRGSFASPSEVTPWAITDNGDVCYWLNRGLSVDPDGWQIAVNESRGPDWEVADLSTTAWLEAVLSRRLTIRLFPADFPSTSPRFQPAE